MVKSLSLLQNLGSQNFHLDPFPHVIIESALPDHICDELLGSFPTLEQLGVNATLNNHRWSTPANKCLLIPNISQLWIDLISYHTSADFLSEVLQTFEREIRTLYPSYFSGHLYDHAARSKVRDSDPTPPGFLTMDAQICGNTPVRVPGQPNKVHFDATNALYAGLYYLRQKDDDSIGGDLQIWRWKDKYSYRKKASEYGPNIASKHIELVKTIPYQANTFVLMLNSIDSLHAVTVREPTPHTRQFLNLLADGKSPFFELHQLPHLRLRNIVRRRLKAS